MSRCALIVLFLALATVAGCDGKSFQKNPGENTPYGKAKIGMSIGEAKDGSPCCGFGRGYDQLPLRPTPKERFPGLPDRMEWFVWSGTDTEPIMVLGVVEGKVVFKEVVMRSGNSGTSESACLPEYRYKTK